MKSIIIVSAIMMLDLMFGGAVQGQEYNLINGQTVNINARLQRMGTIYDDGGASGEYSHNFDGYAVIDAGPYLALTLTGRYSTESGCDKISIWDGDNTTGTLVYNNVSGSGTVNVTSLTGKITIYFHTDYSVTYSGFAFQYTATGFDCDESACANTTSNLTISNIQSTSADLAWQSSGSGPYYVSVNEGTPVTVTGTTYSFTGLNPNTLYTARVTSEANSTPCCYTTGQFRTSCDAMTAPVVERFDDYGTGEDIIPPCWHMQCTFDNIVPAYVCGDTYSSSPSSLRLFTTTTGYWSAAVGPEIVSPSISSLYVRVKIRAPYSGTSVEVGICNDTTLYSVSSTFTPLDTLTVSTANQWKEFLIPLYNYPGSGKYLAFRMDGSLQSGDNRVIYIDDLFVESCGIWNLSLLKRNAHNLWVQWETYGSPSLTAEYGPMGFVPGMGTRITNPTAPLHLSGLDASTSYEVRLYPTCTSSAPAETYRSVTLTTLEGPRNDLNLCEGFEESGNMPEGWRSLNPYNSTPEVSTSYRHSGSRALRMRPNYQSTQPIAVLPMIDTVDISHLNVGFWVYSDGYNSGRVVVGVMEYPEETESFVAVDTVFVDASSVWQHKQVNLGTYSGSGKYLALMVFDPNTYYNSMYIDDLEVGTCLLRGATVTNIGTHKVELRWDSVDDSYHGDSVIVEYGGAGFTAGEGIRLAVAVRGAEVQTVGDKQTVTISGLEADSSYEFHIYGQCDTMVQACAVAILTAHTQATELPLPFCVDFEGMADGSYPSGWFRPSMYENTPRIYDNGYAKHSGNRALYLRRYYDNHATVVLPLLDVDSVQGLVLSLYTWSESSYGQTLQVGVMDDPNDESTFTPVASRSIPYNRWSSHVIPITPYTGSGRYIALRHTDGYSWSSSPLWIDDIIVSDAAVTNPQVSSITSHGATFSWDSAGRSYNGAYVEWDTAGFVQGTGHKDTVDANTFSLTIDTLHPDTHYDFFITPLSSEADGICNFTCQSFTTFDQPTKASFCYGFEDVANNGYPVGWTRPATYDSRPRVSQSYHHTGSSSLNLYCYNCGTDNNTLAAMPYLEEEDLSGLTLSFYAYGGSYSCYLSVGFLTDPNDPTTFDTLETFPLYNWSQWTPFTLDLGQYTGTGRHLAFLCHAVYCNSGDFYIDDITINRCRVNRVRSYSETTHSVTIDWQPDGIMDSVEVEYGLQGFAPGSGTIVATTDTLLTLSGLSENSTYDFYVRPYCTGSSQQCSEQKYQFSTLSLRVGNQWCENFEDNTGNYGIPLHWSRPAMQDYWPEIWVHSEPQYYTSYQCAFEYRSHNGGCNIAVMPASEDPLNELIVSLMVRGTNPLHPERACLIVGAMPNPFDTSAFLPIDTIHPSYSYRRYDVSLASYSGPFRHVAFKYIDPSNSYYPTYTDDIVLSHCRPSNVRVTNVADSSIVLSWERLGYSDTTRILYGLLGDDFSEGTLLSVLGTDTSLLNLLPDTTYWFYLYGSCVDTLIPCQGVEVQQRTLSEPMTAPICFQFEESSLSNGLPNGWIRPYGNTEAGIVSNSSYNHTLPGSQSLHLYAHQCENPDQDRTNMVAMPALQAQNLDGLWLEFFSMVSDNRIRTVVGILSDPYDTSSFFPLDTISGSPAWHRHTISLASYSGTGRHIAFKSFAPHCSSGDIYIDDINIRPCIISTARAGQPTNHSLTLSFTTSSGATGAWVEFRQVGGAGQDFTPGTGDTLFLPSSPYTFSGLEEATWYAFHVYPVCGGTASDGCSYVTTVAQTLHPGVDIPYCENFDNYTSGSFPNNWRRFTSFSDSRPNIYSGANHSADNALYFQVDGEGYTLAVMPRLNVGQTCPLVDSLYANFWLYSDNNYSSAAFIVGIVTDANDPSSFIPIDTLRPSTHASWEHHTVPIRNFSSTDTYVAYKLVSTDNNYTSVRIDDLCMEKCVAADVTVSDITQNSVTVSWTSFGVDSLVCEYGPRGFAAGSGTTVVLHSSPAVIDNLLDGTDYQFSFASVCGCQQYGATYSPGGGSTGGGGGGGGCRYCGWCWGWTWHYPSSPSDSTYRYWCWGPWHGHSWNWSPGGGGGGGSTYYPPVVDTVTTQASFLQIPYCESFEDYDTIAWPRSWRRIGGQTPGFPTLTRNNHHFGTTSLNFYASPGSSNYAALAPLQPGTTSDMVLSFFAYATNDNATGANARFIVGVMTDPDNASTFTPLDTVRLSATGTWEQQVVDLAPYAGSGQYVAFRFAPVNASYHYYIDDIYLGTCAISNASTTTTPSAVTLSWQSHHTPTGVLVEYGPQGFAPGGPSSLGTLQFDASPVNLTSSGIFPDDNYDLYVTAICNDTAIGCFTSPLTLNPRLNLPYCEDFEDIPVPEWPQTLYPDRWNIVQRNSNRPQYPRIENHYGQNVIAFYPSTGDNSNTVLLPPLPDDDTLQGKWVYALFSSSNNNYIYLDFGYLTDTNNPSSFVQMASLSNSDIDQLREFNIQLTSDSPATNRLALRARSTSSDRWIRLSKLVVSNYPYPTAITSTALGVDKRHITWSGQYNNPYYSIQYGYSDQWQTITLSDSCSATLTGLRPGRHYQVYFISPDGHRLCLPYQFTNEEYTPLPYCDDFESYPQHSLPSGCSRAASWSSNYGYPRVECNVQYSSPYRSLQFHNGCSSNRWDQLSLPDIDIDSIRNLSLRFRMRSNYSANNTMIIGIQTEKDNPLTFSPIDTLQPSTSWQTFNISLSSYNGNGRYITFRYLQSDGSCHYAYIDDLTISPCPLPNISVAGARQVKTQLPTGGSPDYYIEYDTAGFLQGTGTILHVTQDPFYITELNPNTSYSFYSRCDSLSITCATPTTLTTAQELALPLCDNFDTYTSGSYHAPSGWYSYYSGDNNSYYPYVYNYYYYASSCCQSLYFYTHRNHYEYTAMPDLDVDSIGHLELYFNLRVGDKNYTKLIVGVMQQQNDISTFVPVDTVSCKSNNNYEAKHISLASYPGNGRFIAFQILITDNNWRDLFLDDLRISNYPTPQITLYNANTVRIIREDNRDFWIEMAPKEALQGDDTNRWFHITQDTFDITDLEYLTTYDFYHHADSGTITCFPRTRITTSTVLSMPYCENFNSYSNYTIPPSWTKYNPYNNDFPGRHSNGHLQFYNSCYSNSRSYAIMPELDIDSLRHAELYLRVQNDNSNNYLLVGVMTDKSDINTFTAVDTLKPSGTGSFHSMHASMQRYQGDGRFIAFCFVTPTGNCSSLYIDDLYIQSCPRPSIQLVGGTTVASIIDTNHTADYWLEYGLQGMTPGAVDTLYNADSSEYTLQPHNTLVHVTTDTLLIPDLTENTTYDFYARCDSAHTDCYIRTAQITTSRVQALPYCEEFSSYGTGSDAFPTGWKRHTSNNSNDYLQIINDNAGVDSRILRFRIYNSLYACAVLPEMDIENLSDVTIRVSQWSQGSTDATEKFLEVGVMTDMDDIATFQAVDTLQNTLSGCWQELSASLANYTGNGRFIAIRMRSTTSNWRNLYWDRLEILTCDIPASTKAILHSHNQVRIDADEQSNSGFWVEYGTTGFEQGTGNYEYVDTLPLVLTLDNNTTYDFYFRCDTVTSTCLPAQTVTTMSAPLSLPVCINFDTCANNSMPNDWRKYRLPDEWGTDCYIHNDQSHSSNQSLRFCSYYNSNHPYAVLPYIEVESLSKLAVSFWMRSDNNPESFILELGVMSDPSDVSTFLTLKRFSNTSSDTWQRMQTVLTDAPEDAHFVAFRLAKNNNYNWDWLYIDDLYFDTCGASEWHITSVESDYVTFDWKQTGEPSITLEYGPVGFARGSGSSINITNPPYALTGLSNLTNYQFYFDASCTGGSGFCTTDYSDSTTIFTPTGGTGCIDPTNLTANYTTCFYGSFGNPYQNTGIVNFGSESILSRHTVHYDTTERDLRTGGELRTIPEGAQSSVRLGNWGSTSEAEAVTYSLFVDSTQFDLLILKYAAVLQDRLHPSTSQPRFKIEILDENGALIDANCGAADFIANQNLGWHLIEENYVLWKDWTTVGIDMSAYYGRTVQIRLTTYDCGDGQHYGYAYFTLNCLQKTMISERCGEVDFNRFSAPSGFAYNWYTNLNDSVFSHEQSIEVPTNNAITYYCRCAFIDKEDCFFTLSAFAGTRYPLAQMEYTQRVENCRIYVDFHNTSTISADGTTPIGTGEGCEDAWWDLGNGDTVTTYNAQGVYNSSGTYTVTLISSIAGGSCSDTATYSIDLSMSNVMPLILGDSSACNGDSVDLQIKNAVNYLWSTGESSDSIRVAVGPADTWSCFVTDSNGCIDTLRHSVTIHPVYDITLDTSVYKDFFPLEWPPYSITLDDHMLNGGDTLITFHLSSAQHCDSTVNYNLTALFDIEVVLDSTICESNLPLTWNDSIFDAAGSKQRTLKTVYGGDSTITMNLTVISTTYGTFLDTIVENQLPYDFLHHSYTTDTVGDTLMLANEAGCDSILTYSLAVHRNSEERHDTTVCESLLPLPFYSHTFVRDELEGLSQGMLELTVHDTLTRLSGADSVLHITLRAIRIPSLSLSADTTILRGDSTILRATTSHGTLVWLDADGAQLASADSLVAAPPVHTTYYLSSLNIDEGANMVLNGDFETGNTGFTTDYTFGNTGSHGHYYVGHDIAEMWPWDSPGFAVGDHSSGTGQMLMVDGATQPNTTVWSQTLPVAPHTDYLFSSWVLTDNQGFFKYEINGAQAGFDYASPEAQWEWRRYSQLWNSDTCTRATLRIVNRYSQSAGYDYCIDDISFSPLTECSVLDSVTVRTLVSTTTDSVVCNNHLPILWHGRSIDSTGIYADTVRGETVDTLALLHLTVNLVTASDATVMACDSLLWHDSCYYSTGTPSHVVTNSAGCDSTITLLLTVHHSSTGTDLLSACDSLIWLNGTTYTANNNSDTAMRTNAAGCDSTITLNLTIRHSTAYTDVVSACDSLVWLNGTTYTTNNSTDTVMRTNSVGCDSTITLNLSIRHSSDTTITDTIVENQLPYPFNGASFNDSISHTAVVITNAAACDSIIDYSLFVFRNVMDTLDSTLCNGQLPLTWNGVTFDTTVTQTSTITRTATMPAASGADSVVVMNLTVHPLYDHHLDTAICDNQSLSFGDSIFMGADGNTVHLDSLLSVFGCDSLSTLHLTVHPTFHPHQYDTICTSVSYSWGTPQRELFSPFYYNGAENAIDTIVTDTLTSAYGCDSLSSLHLHMLPAYNIHFYDTICDSSLVASTWQRNSFTFDDSTFSSEGIHILSYTTENCDSIHTLHLTMNPTYNIIIYDSIFDGDRYPFEGRYLDTTGVYEKLLTTQGGCDSLRTIHLQCNPRTPSDTVVCRNALPITWNGITFTDAGTDSVRLVGREGIDSLVVMHVIVIDTASTIVTIHACDSLLWEDSVMYYLSTNAPFRLFTTAQGCDSVVHLNLTMDTTHYFVDRQVVCDSLLWNDGLWYYRDTTSTVGPLGSGWVSGPVDTLSTIGGCDSVVSLDLTIHPSYYSSSTDTICYNQSYLWHDLSVSPSAETYSTKEHLLIDTMKTVWNCDSVLALQLTQLGRPRVRIDYDYNCRQNRYYLSAQATLDWGLSEPRDAYITWNSYPYDSLVSESTAAVEASPHEDPTLYYVYADYREIPTCPVGDSLRLRPIVIPEARLQVNPEALSHGAHEFNAYDVSHVYPYSMSPDSSERWQRTWLLDWNPLYEQSTHLYHDITSSDVDSVIVALEIFNGQCFDTAVHVVQVIRTKLLAPNVFTPNQDANSRFTVAMQGVITAELFIYNREGLLVYRTTDLEQGWDGRNLSGTPCQQGNYVWKLVYKANDYPTAERTEIGSVLLLR